jgi:16S rRNA U1498 N3-methylase RsmE
MPRILLSSQLIEMGLNGEEFNLDFETAKKLTRVLRLTPGEMFVAFDGSGREWECVLTATQNEDPSAAKALWRARRFCKSAKCSLKDASSCPSRRRFQRATKSTWCCKKAPNWALRVLAFEAERSISKILSDDDSERATVRADRWRKIVGPGGDAMRSRRFADCTRHQRFFDVVGYGTQEGRCFMLDETPEIETLRQAMQREPIVWDEKRRHA